MTNASCLTGAEDDFGSGHCCLFTGYAYSVRQVVSIDSILSPFRSQCRKVDPMGLKEQKIRRRLVQP